MSYVPLCCTAELPEREKCRETVQPDHPHAFGAWTQATSQLGTKNFTDDDGLTESARAAGCPGPPGITSVASLNSGDTLIWQHKRLVSSSPQARSEHVLLLLVRRLQGVVQFLLEDDVARRARELAAAGRLNIHVVVERRLEHRLADLRLYLDGLAVPAVDEVQGDGRRRRKPASRYAAL